MSPSRRFAAAVVAGLFVLCLVLAANAQPQSPPKTGNAKSRGGSNLTLKDALKFGTTNVEQVLRYRRDGEADKGSYQRSPFGLQDLSQRIQIAFVIDGTLSMKSDIAGLKESLVDFTSTVRKSAREANGLASVSNVDLQLAVIVYRDLKSPSGAVQNVTGGFQNLPIDRNDNSSSRIDTVIKTLDAVQIEDGKPRFQEQVDRGLHTALTKLAWIPAVERATRLVILAGDAPPWDEAWLGKDGRAARPEDVDITDLREPLRSFSTVQLVAEAEQRKITIHSILCRAGFGTDEDEVLRKVAADARPDLRRFMSAVSQSTGGTVVDLSDPEATQRIAASAGKPPVVLRELREIKQADLEALRKKSPVRVAVVPPVPLDEMPFTDARPAIRNVAVRRVAIPLVSRLRQVPGLNVQSLDAVNAALQALRTADDKPPVGAGPQPTLSQLAARLDVDLILWGDYEERQAGARRLSLKAFDREGQLLAETEVKVAADNTDAEELVGRGFVTLSQPLAAKLSERGNRAAAVLARVEQNERLAALLRHPAVGTAEARETLIDAQYLLERATQFASDAPEGKAFLQQARTALEKAIDYDREHADPGTLLLLASCDFNLGEKDAAEAKLREAFKNRERAGDPAIRTEIEADHALFIEKKPEEAIRLYEELAASTEVGQPQTSLRALWMLAGLYLGDWGVAEANYDLVSMDKATEKVLTILVYWPESPEGRFYSRFVEARQDVVRPQMATYLIGATLRAPVKGRTRYAQSQPTRAPGEI